MRPLIIGGTTEGRMAAEVCEEAGTPFYYSTKGASQEVPLHYGILITGGMDARELHSFCTTQAIGLIIDAAHPFASQVHRNVGKVAVELSIPIIRFERQYSEVPAEAIRVSSFTEALTLLHETKPVRLLVLTGVNSIPKLSSYWQHHETYFRVMPIPQSKDLIAQSGISRDRIIYYHQEVSDEALFQQLQPDAILIKESGTTSGFDNKVQTALQMGIQVIVISKPPLGYEATVTVIGKIGLRRAIESLLPGFFPLKMGFTTGTTATAATTVALHALLYGEKLEQVAVELPNGELIPFPIHATHIEANSATAVAIKYAGDDPDVTDGAEIHASVSLNREHVGIHFLQGEGVGKVTLPGIGLPIGDPAINKVPRQMITQAVENLLDTSKVGVNITLSVPEGREIATRTFNPRLGIVDGISILGTTGVVRPYSLDTWVASIEREIEVSKAVGVEHLVLNSGGRSESYLKSRFPQLPSNAFVQYGNFIKEALEKASKLSFAQITLGIMIGKAVKLADGELDTHSKKATLNHHFIRHIAQESQLREEQLQQVEQITMARELWSIIPDRTSPFYQNILQYCYEMCKPLVPYSDLDIVLIDDQGQFITLAL